MSEGFKPVELRCPLHGKLNIHVDVIFVGDDNMEVLHCGECWATYSRGLFITKEKSEARVAYETGVQDGFRLALPEKERADD